MNASESPGMAARIGRLFLYAIIGFILIVLITRSSINTDQLVKWAGFAGGTAVLFWNLVKHTEISARDHRFRRRFSILLAAHSVALGVVLTTAPVFKPIWLLGMIAEYPFLTLFARSPGRIQ